MFKKRPGSTAAQADGPATSPTADAETGLPNHRELQRVLRREIARARRYGDRSALAVFDVRVVGFRESKDESEPPSPAAFVANVLTKEARQSDFVARLDLTRFVVFLTECDNAGARLFTERLRTELCSQVFTRGADGHGLFVRAWAGCVPWEPEYSEAGSYLRAALRELEHTRPGYIAAQGEFAGPKAANY